MVGFSRGSLFHSPLENRTSRASRADQPSHGDGASQRSLLTRPARARNSAANRPYLSDTFGDLRCDYAAKAHMTAPAIPPLHRMTANRQRRLPHRRAR